MNKAACLALCLTLAGALAGASGGADAPAPGANSPTAAADGADGLGMVLGVPDPAALQGLLALSPDQKEKLEVIRQAARAQHAKHLQRLRALVESLAAQLQAKAPESDLQGTLQRLKAERLSQQADQNAALDEAQGVLSPTQAAQYVVYLRDQMMQAGYKRWKTQHGR